MTYDALARFEDLWKRIDSTLNPQWQKDMANLTNMYAKWAVPKFELPTLSGPKIQDIVGTHLSGLGQSPALKDAAAAHRELLAYSKSQVRLQEIAQGLGQSFDLSNLGGMTVWRDLVKVDPTILKGVAVEAFSAMGIGKIGGLTGVLGPKASAAAGLYGFTHSDLQGVHLSEDHALEIVLEAKELLSDEENVAALADVEVDEALIRDFESFFLTSERAKAVYEAATAEIAIPVAGSKDRLQLRGMMVLSLFFVLYTVLICGIAGSKPGQDVALMDHLMALGGTLAVRTVVDNGAKLVDRVRKMSDDEEDPQ